MPVERVARIKEKSSERVSLQSRAAFFFFITLLLLVTAAFFLLIKDFLLACFWAVILAVVFDSTYQKIRAYYKDSEGWALFTTMFTIIFVFVLPLCSLIWMITQESVEYYGKIQSGEIKPAVYFQNALSFLRSLGINVEQLSGSVGNLFSQALGFTTQQVPAITQNILNLIVQTGLTFYILYFLLRDGRQLVNRLITRIPIGDRIEIKLFRRFASVSRAAVKGGLIVAVVQGSIGGLLFWLVGIPAATLWGALMIILSLLPIGSSLIWAPAGVILLMQGETLRGVIVLAVGMLIIGLVDNFLRAHLIDKDVHIPDYLVLVSTLGGLTWFSLSGFVLGPVIAALFLTCWEILGEVLKKDTQQSDL